MSSHLCFFILSSCLVSCNAEQFKSVSRQGLAPRRVEHRETSEPVPVLHTFLDLVNHKVTPCFRIFVVLPLYLMDVYQVSILSRWVTGLDRDSPAAVTRKRQPSVRYRSTEVLQKAEIPRKQVSAKITERVQKLMRETESAGDEEGMKEIRDAMIKARKLTEDIRSALMKRPEFIDDKLGLHKQELKVENIPDKKDVQVIHKYEVNKDEYLPKEYEEVEVGYFPEEDDEDEKMETLLSVIEETPNQKLFSFPRAEDFEADLLTEDDTDSVLAYLVEDGGSEFLVTKEAILRSGRVSNKAVSMKSFTRPRAEASAKVEIVDNKHFQLTNIHFSGHSGGSYSG